MADPAARVDALTKRFGDLTAVDRLSFTVECGELFGLVGPDGAGKTTTLRMLAAVMRPTSGDAFINGLSVSRQPERVKHDIAYMSQRFGLYGDLTVLENLNFYADLYRVPAGERVSRLKRLFQFSNLEPFQNRLAGKLSGGMKQKLGLSCALIHQPEILLLDEPTFGVDPVSRRDLWLIVHEMVAQGTTVIVSTAYMDEAERFDRLVLIHEGKLLALDTPDALREQTPGELLSVKATELREARDILRANPRVHHVAMFGDRLHLSVDSARQDALIIETALKERGIQGIEIAPVAPSLEDIFIRRVADAEAS
jgi:ABC-2 type transport system ATP-binding protein